ncbi:methionine ABC transporter ATP-binding protein [Terrilactibacillus laevilacticus]|uniref:Methionine ABC transporter ATP-binding protein n=1 Tax=Terrilactibacillus laevilacticus TaxID=1380157 RepID=A0ABW5PSI8_9BACI|nr:methionine ABC transporter ATP-binding protein [Terrilactibacillus laevilacticus]
MIRLDNITKIYQTSNGPVEALKDISLDVKEGEIFGIIGYSGAGKSTLIRLINLLEQPTSGSIRVHNQDLSQLTGKKLRRERQKIGMIFQHFNLLWSRTVAENIEFPLEIAKVPKKVRKERVKELITLVGLEGRDKSYPSQLSGGQKQRVGIARALANNPKVLLCDEATSALDPKTTNSILKLLVKINRNLGLTIVLITHEMHVIQSICHRVGVLDKGHIVEEGRVKDVFNHPKEDITKEFVKQVNESDEWASSIEDILSTHRSGKVVKLTFNGDIAEQPIVNDIYRDTSLTINIVWGKISHTQEGALGTLVLHIDGDQEKNIEKAIDFVKSKGVLVEVIEHGAAIS